MCYTGKKSNRDDDSEESSYKRSAWLYRKATKRAFLPWFSQCRDGRDFTIFPVDTEIRYTFEGGRYTNNICACIYELLSLNVGVHNVGLIICCVLKCLVHKSVDHFPSYGLTCQMTLESLTVAQAQLVDKLAHTSASSYYAANRWNYKVWWTLLNNWY